MKENSVVVNWNYVTLSVVVFALITVAVLYMPGLREIDMEMLKVIRKFLGQFPSYIPVFFSNYGGVGNFWWPQITAGAVLVSHRKYLKAFLLVFFTQGGYIFVDLIKNFICREGPGLNSSPLEAKNPSVFSLSNNLSPTQGLFSYFLRPNIQRLTFSPTQAFTYLLPAQ